EIGHLEFRNGTIDGAGSFTVTHELRWINGTMTGAGKVILADGAEASIGYGHDPEHPGSQSAAFLGRSFDIRGDATLERGLIYLGTSEYDGVTGTNRYFDGVLSVKSGGELHLAGAYADIYESQSSSDNRVEIAAGGVLLKEGGGTSVIG